MADKQSKLEGIAMAVIAIARLEKCSIDDVFKKFNVGEKIASEVRPLIEAIEEYTNSLLDAVDNMSEQEFKDFVERMKK